METRSLTIINSYNEIFFIDINPIYEGRAKHKIAVASSTLAPTWLARAGQDYLIYLALITQDETGGMQPPPPVGSPEQIVLDQINYYRTLAGSPLLQLHSGAGGVSAEPGKLRPAKLRRHFGLKLRATRRGRGQAGATRCAGRGIEQCGTACYALIPVNSLQPARSYTEYVVGRVDGTPFNRTGALTTTNL